MWPYVVIFDVQYMLIWNFNLSIHVVNIDHSLEVPEIFKIPNEHMLCCKIFCHF